MSRTLNDSLIEADIVSLQLAMESGLLSSEACVRWYLKRIERLNPKLKAVLEVNPDALAVAEALDAERREHGARGPLHGIPILLKDNIDTADQCILVPDRLLLRNILHRVIRPWPRNYGLRELYSSAKQT